MIQKPLLNPDLAREGRKRTSLSNLAYEAIREAIVSGRVRPGEWLRQEALAGELGMNQVTVREALRRLAAEGLVVHEPNKGVRAASPPLGELLELGRLRALLEGIAMEEAAVHISGEDLARMRQILPRLAGLSEQAALDATWEENREFHWIAIRASGQPNTIRFLRHIWDLMNPWLLAGEPTEDFRLRGYHDDVAQHEELLAALEARDGRGARAAAVRHVLARIRILSGEVGESSDGGDGTLVADVLDSVLP